MEKRKNSNKLLRTFAKVFKRRKYIAAALISGFAFYLINILFLTLDLTTKAYSNSGISESAKLFLTLAISPNKIILPHSINPVVILSILVGVLFALILYKVNLNVPLGRKTGFLSGIGIFIAALAPGCAICGIGLVSLLGISGAVISFLPYNGIELTFLSIGILAFAIFKITKDLSNPAVCKIKLKKMKGGQNE